MDYLYALLISPEAWLALMTLIAMEVVLGIDNLIFISILTNKLPEHQRSTARRVGISAALILRLVFLSMVAFIVTLKQPLFSILGQSFSWRDLIFISGGLFLIWKATSEVRHKMAPPPAEEGDMFEPNVRGLTFGAAIFQILLIDMVFSIDSIVTAVGMTDHIPIMVIAVIVAVLTMLLAADPLANFINNNPTVVMLALGFLLMIGTMLVAEGFGMHIPKGYIYAAMAFSIFVEGLNMAAARAAKKHGNKPH